MTSDILITNATVFTGNALIPGLTSLAVSGGRIVGIGDTPTVRRLLGASPEIVDVHGALVTPGFLDCHVHPMQAGLERLSCDLTDSTSAQSALDMVADYAHSHPDEEWIVGGGWHMQHFPGGMPAAELLDSIAPGRKIYLVNADHHGAWVSSAGMAAAGIDRDTPNPSDGIIDRNPDGTPHGTFQEGAMEIFQPLLPEPDLDQRVAALVEAQEYYHSLGIVGWQDAIVGEYAGSTDSTDAYLAAVDRGVLNHIVTAALWLRRDITLNTMEEAISGYLAQRARFGDRSAEHPQYRLRATSIKIMMDGVPESQTAALKQPYLDPCGHPTENSGTTHFTQDVLLAILPRLACAGFQLHFHAIGDRAISNAIDVIEAARSAGANPGLNHHIAHLQQMDLADIPRFVASGAIANIQALWAANSQQMRELNLPIFGEDRYRIQYPFGSLARAGARLAMGSDWPVSTPDPWQAIHVAVNRREPGDVSEPPLGPSEALDLATCVSAYTMGSSAVFQDDTLGRIAVGAPAHIAIADRNPFEHPAEDIWLTKNRMTLLGGEVVYSAQ